MVYQETSIGEGIYAADENNEANSERGAFVRSGGQVTVGASSQDIALNIDACDIRIQTTDWSIASGTVTLADNSTAYPRRDLVFASKGPTASDPGSFEVSTGTPIDNETMQTLVNEGVVNQDGTPIAKPEDIPEIQPPAFQGHRDDSTLLAMVYVPPGATDSTAIAGSYITDLRMEGIGVTDVLRTGDAIQNIESSADTLQTTVKNSERFGSHTPDEFRQRTVSISEVLPANANVRHYIFVPQNMELAIRRVGIVDANGQSPVDLFVRVFAEDGTVLDTYNDATQAVNTDFAGGRVIDIQFVNGTNTEASGFVAGYLHPA